MTYTALAPLLCVPSIGLSQLFKLIRPKLSNRTEINDVCNHDIRSPMFSA